MPGSKHLSSVWFTTVAIGLWLGLLVMVVGGEVSGKGDSQSVISDVLLRLSQPAALAPITRSLRVDPVRRLSLGAAKRLWDAAEAQDYAPTTRLACLSVLASATRGEARSPGQFLQLKKRILKAVQKNQSLRWAPENIPWVADCISGNYADLGEPELAVRSILDVSRGLGPVPARARLLLAAAKLRYPTAPSKALSLLTQASQVEGAGKKLKADIALWEGYASQRASDPDAANRYLAKARNLAPSQYLADVADADIAYMKARKGDVEGALKCIRALLPRYPADTPLGATLHQRAGLYLERLGRTEEAIKMYDAVRKQCRIAEPQAKAAYLGALRGLLECSEKQGDVQRALTVAATLRKQGQLNWSDAEIKAKTISLSKAALRVPAAAPVAQGTQPAKPQQVPENGRDWLLVVRMIQSMPGAGPSSLSVPTPFTPELLNKAFHRIRLLHGDLSDAKFLNELSKSFPDRKYSVLWSVRLPLFLDHPLQVAQTNEFARWEGIFTLSFAGGKTTLTRRTRAVNAAGGRNASDTTFTLYDSRVDNCVLWGVPPGMPGTDGKAPQVFVLATTVPPKSQQTGSKKPNEEKK